jgi:DNA-binding transcriptional ArsR family regulator
MTSRDDETRIDEDVVAAVGALGNRTRLEILLALAEAQRERQEQWLQLSFTELYRAVDVESTSQFSYHLDRLVGPFLAETDGGYRLTYGGDKIVRTLLAGFYENTRSFDDTKVDGVCVFCESESLVATVDREQFVVRCDDCESGLLTDLLPRSQTRHRSAGEIVDSVGARIWGSVTLIRDGVCPECYGRVDTTVESHPHGDRTLYTLKSTCRECWLTINVPLEAVVARHPAGAAFFREHGVSLFERPLWEFFEHIVAETVTVDVETVDPLAATVEITLDGETRRLEVDDELTVTSLSRSGPDDH